MIPRMPFVLALFPVVFAVQSNVIQAQIVPYNGPFGWYQDENGNYC